MTNGAHRKVVTVLFCDVVGSTALGESVDPEALQGLLARYFERMKAIVESHGGTVEKFIGDAVMAVFGVPVAHEDDALRACRAAVEMRDALPELGVEGRIGVNTGEVLTGTEERLATGDAVNVAARFEQAAEAGEVLIGAETLALVESAVEAGAERMLELKGKREPVSAYQLVAVLEVAERAHVSRFVGRERELQQLADTWDRALAGPRCELLTVVGDPGVGKSRLVAEALAQIGARVVRGRCLSYGEGITYWPVIEVVKQLHARPEDEHAAMAIASLLGENETLASTDEIAWAFRKLLEAQAPMIVCFDDIQWGEETFLNLVESMSLLSVGAPVLLLCMARPELLDRRPGWPGVLRLEPLPEDEARMLVGDAVPDSMRERIVRASSGNPLFLTEMAALSGEGGGEVDVPATLRAVLTARLDQLDEPERRVLEGGAVEGELFHRGTVQVLVPEETELTPLLAALVRRDLVRPDRPQLPREDAYRFRHLLIRDAAYDALPKATRADLHGRLAEWLAEHANSLVELDEIRGHHLQQAAGYLDELGRPDRGLAEEAAAHLAAAGRRALWRGDESAARPLLERALALSRPARIDILLELDHAATSEVSEAVALADDAAHRAALAGDAAGAALARAAAAGFRTSSSQGPIEAFDQAVVQALPLLGTSGDHAALAEIWRLAVELANFQGRWADQTSAAEEALKHEEAAGQRGLALALVHGLVFGPTPSDEALARIDLLPGADEHPVALIFRASLLAMQDLHEDALELAGSAAKRLLELSPKRAGHMLVADILSSAGDHEAAVAYLRQGCDIFEATQEFGLLSSYAPRLGRALCAVGRHPEAEPLAARGRELGDAQDAVTQTLWRQVQALALSHRSEHVEAERLAREAVAVAEGTQGPNLQADAWADLAEVLLEAGRTDDAAGALEQALQRFERKKNIPLARRVRERLASLQPA